MQTSTAELSRDSLRGTKGHDKYRKREPLHEEVFAIRQAPQHDFAAPALTLPFCAVATGCYLLGDHVPGLKLR